MIPPFDLQPYLRYFNSPNLSRRYKLSVRRTIVNTFLVKFCDNFSSLNDNWMSTNVVCDTVDECRLGDTHIWEETLDTFQSILEAHFKQSGYLLPVRGILTVDVHNDFANFRFISDEIDHTSPEETMETFRRWVIERENENARTYPKEIYALIDQFISDSGWLP